ncbi:hypothetical protein D3C87_2084380 [compost metagenome]
MQAAPQVVVLADRATEETAEAGERAALQHRLVLVEDDPAGVLRADAVDQNFLDGPCLQRQRAGRRA